MRVLLLLCALTACTEAKRVSKVERYVVIDTIYVAASSDGYMCRMRQPAPAVGDTITCMWSAR